MCSLQEYKGIDMMGIPGASEIMNQELEQYMLEKSENKNVEGGEGVGKYYSSSPKRKSEESSLKHAMAERKRRKRINHHYETLRSLLPHLPKRDKPTVLKETVGRVKELKKKVAQHMATSCSLFIPNEKDELIISEYKDRDNERIEIENKMVKVMICCEDRPGLNKSLSEAMLVAKAAVVKAEMVTIGGRIKAELVVKWRRQDGGGEEDIGMLRRAFKAVLENRAFAASLLFGSRLKDSNSVHSASELELGEYSDTIFDALLF